jgi:hypothetical protein
MTCGAGPGGVVTRTAGAQFQFGAARHDAVLIGSSGGSTARRAGHTQPKPVHNEWESAMPRPSTTSRAEQLEALREMGIETDANAEGSISPARPLKNMADLDPAAIYARFNAKREAKAADDADDD